jgi:hypothetical protein
MNAKRFAFISLMAAALVACNDPTSRDSQGLQQHAQQDATRKKIADLLREKSDALYEIQLREDEMKDMETTAYKPGAKPGVVGVSDEWLQRHIQLKEEVIKLKVKVHDLDAQVADLSKP